MIRNYILHHFFFLFLFFLLGSCVTQPTKELYVMCSGGLTAAYDELYPQFEKGYDVKVRTSYGSSMGGGYSSIPSRLDRGEPADVIILAGEGLEKLAKDGKVEKESRVDLAASLIGMSVKAGDSVPDISTVDRFVQVLLSAKTIAYSASASGTYLSTVLFPQLGIEDQLADKTTRVVGERVGAVVARGEAEIGFQQVSELLPIEGLTFVGTIPDEIQKVTIFSGGIIKNTSNRLMAEKLLQFLASDSASTIIAKTGMEAQPAY